MKPKITIKASGTHTAIVSTNQNFKNLSTDEKLKFLSVSIDRILWMSNQINKGAV